MNQTLAFRVEKNGYEKAQVNAYVEKLIQEYEQMHREFTLLEKKSHQMEQSMAKMVHEKKAATGLASHYRIKISQLETENAKLGAGAPGSAPGYAGAVARVLMDAEVLAGQIVERARQEAVRLNEEAMVERGRLLTAKDRLLEELKTIWEKMRSHTPDTV